MTKKDNSKVMAEFYKVNARKAVKKRMENRLKRLHFRKREKLKELLIDYSVALKSLNDYDRDTIIAQEIRRTTLKSYCLHGDRNWLSPTVILHYIRKDGVPLDVQAQTITEQYGIPVTEQDLIDFINSHQSGTGSFYKFQEVETIKEEIKSITGFNSTPDFIKYLKVNLLQKPIFKSLKSKTPF